MEPKVLIVTGGLITSQENSIWEVAKKLLHQFQNTKAAWLDHKVKLIMAEPILNYKLHEFISYLKHQEATFFNISENPIPSLTEVILATILEKNGLSYEAIEVSSLFSKPKLTEKLIQKTNCVFISSTYLHDLSELLPIIKKLKRAHNRIVLGGALSTILHQTWEGMNEIDVVAVGYGEIVLPSIIKWIKNNYSNFPSDGNLTTIQKKKSIFLIGKLPKTRILDFLETPNWSLFQNKHKPLDTIYYESVRGCPYRCAFCNYPYLFNDKTFRYKSAAKIVEDWEYYEKKLGIKRIICLDSLFTIPRERLLEVCNLIKKKNLNIKWTCYARADDLAKEEIVIEMKSAGVEQVQIGIESGHPQILKNMRKSCSVDTNHQALKNCRKHNLTSAISIIIGYPGETKETVQATYEFLEKTPPDFYFLALFSTRILNVPILNQKNKEKFGLRVMDNKYTMAPYWKHQTMSCLEAANHIRQLDNKLMKNKVALNSVLFYKMMKNFDSNKRGYMLELQKKFTNHTIFNLFFVRFNKWIDSKLKKDLELYL